MFGFRRASVRQLLADRETMSRFAQERAEAAEAKVEELQAELKAGEADNEVQMEAAGSAHAEAQAEFREATDALREEIERPVLAEAKLSELPSELARAIDSPSEGPSGTVTVRLLRPGNQALDHHLGHGGCALARIPARSRQRIVPMRR